MLRIHEGTTCMLLTKQLTLGARLRKTLLVLVAHDEVPFEESDTHGLYRETKGCV